MKDLYPKRSNEPIVWFLFGAGGTVSAIFFPILVLLIGILLPLGLLDPTNIFVFSHSWIGKLAIMVFLIFPIWCGLHRVFFGLHDLKVHIPSPAGGFIFYGLACLYSLLVIITVFAI